MSKSESNIEKEIKSAETSDGDYNKTNSLGNKINKYMN